MNGQKILWLAVACAAFAGCTFRTRFSTSTHAAYGLEERTETKSIRIDEVPGCESTEIALDVDLDAGSVSWSLLDPDGLVRWADATTAEGRLQGKRTFEPKPGTWTLTWSLRDFTGCYSVNLSAEGGAKVVVTVERVEINVSSSPESRPVSREQR